MDPLLKRSLITSLLVGSVLIFINQFDHIISGNWNTQLLIKILITPIVPFIVSFVSGKLSAKHFEKTLSELQELKNNDLSIELGHWNSGVTRKLKAILSKFLKDIAQNLNGLVVFTYEMAKTSSRLVKAQVNIEQLASETIDSSQKVDRKGQVLLESFEEATQQNRLLNQDLEKVILLSNKSLTDARTVEDELTKVRSMLELQKANSEEVGHVVDIINSITFQSKLLSFNAAVEAARAGEAGKGFAVVAQEIKNLSDSTSNSADQISKQIEKIVTNISSVFDGFLLMENSILHLKQRVESIHEACEHQRQSMLNVI